MSGGHFEYKEAYLGYIHDQLQEDRAAVYAKTLVYDYPETERNVCRIEMLLIRLQTVLRAYDYFICADSDEELFNKAFNKLLDGST